MKTMVTPEQALEIVLQHTGLLSAEKIRHADALGRTLAEDITAPHDLPPFDNSAMDGYAVIASDLEGATSHSPISLSCIEVVGAGETPTAALTPGHCTKIMTGAPLPPGATAVVMREDTEQADETVRFFVAAEFGGFIRRRGIDVEQGKVVLTSGSVIGAAQWAMLASLGYGRLNVAQKPRIGIISTGAELVDIDVPLKNGQIRDSNSYALRALVASCGCEVVEMRQCGDRVEEFEGVLREVTPHCDVIITSGGVSAGDFDPVRDVLRDHAQVHFWKIAMKPGKPVMFAEFERKLVFGLPGNPVSVMVAFEEFVRPALLQMSGRQALKRMEISARVMEAFSSPAGKVEYVRAFLKFSPNGAWEASVDSDQSSNRLSTLTKANALLVVPAEQTEVKVGEFLRARLIDCPEIE